MLPTKQLKIFITGASGFIGSELLKFLREKGHEASSINRPYIKDKLISLLEGADCVIHLAGESIVSRWTEDKKKSIFDSRINSTRIIVEALSQLKSKPKTFICASGIGYYGYNCGDRTLDENSPLGEGFLASVCKEWEHEAQKGSALGIRVVNTRFGLVLSPKGGALKKMLLPFKLGVGGIIGDGKQYLSWISHDDVINGIYHCIQTESLSGPVNFCSENPLTNYEFTKALGAVLQRPTVLPVPEFVLKIVFGEMAQETLLASQRAIPKKLLDSGYKFLKSNIQDSLLL